MEARRFLLPISIGLGSFLLGLILWRGREKPVAAQPSSGVVSSNGDSQRRIQETAASNTEGNGRVEQTPTVPESRPARTGTAATETLQRLVRLCSGTGGMSREVSAFSQELTALFTEDESAIADVVERLLCGELPRGASSMVVSALGRAGTRAAQKALRGIVQGETLESGMRQEALTAMTTSQEPDAATVELLRQLSIEERDASVRHRAIVGLGLVANRSKTDPAAAQEWAQFLSKLETNLPAAELPSYLAALGNAGLDGTFDIVTGYTAHASDEIRAQAVYALRLMEKEEVNGLMFEKLRQDSSASVRLLAVRALSDRDGESAWAGMRLAVGDESVDVRREAAVWLVQRLSSGPEARMLLRTLARSDPSEDLRRFASAALRTD